MTQEATHELKYQASLAFQEVIKTTRKNFPDTRYHPNPYLEMLPYSLSGIRLDHQSSLNSDGAGTKPELAERLFAETSDPKYFGNLAFDTFAMVDGDCARFGHFLLGIDQNIETNIAIPEVIKALAVGTKRACDEGKFALLNGETAQLGYRVSGFGKARVNWNATGHYLIVNNKLILGDKLAAGQPIVALKENGLRSNGFSQINKILETVYLNKKGYKNKEEYLLDNFYNHFLEGIEIDDVKKKFTAPLLSSLMGHDFLEQVLVRWHQDWPDLAQELLIPSILYGRVINEAQGWIDGKKQVEITAAAHITEGGIPEKLKRVLRPWKLGAHIEHYESILPDPKGLKEVFKLAQTLPEDQKENLINDKLAGETWGRGIGFLVVTKTVQDANKLRMIAQSFGITAATAGKIISKPQIEWRGHIWRY